MGLLPGDTASCCEFEVAMAMSCIQDEVPRPFLPILGLCVLSDPSSTKLPEPEAGSIHILLRVESFILLSHSTLGRCGALHPLSSLQREACLTQVGSSLSVGENTEISKVIYLMLRQLIQAAVLGPLRV